MEMVSCTECNTDVELADPKENDGCCPECGSGPFCASCLSDVHECESDEVEDDESDDSEDEDEGESEEAE